MAKVDRGAEGFGFGSFFRKAFGWKISWESEKILRSVAIARGSRNTDELLVSLGRERTGISFREAVDMLQDELGPDAYDDYVKSKVFSEGRTCQKYMEKYQELIELGDEIGLAPIYRKDLEKYCGYRFGEEGH